MGKQLCARSIQVRKVNASQRALEMENYGTLGTPGELLAWHAMTRTDMLGPNQATVHSAMPYHTTPDNATPHRTAPEHTIAPHNICARLAPFQMLGSQLPGFLCYAGEMH